MTKVYPIVHDLSTLLLHPFGKGADGCVHGKDVPESREVGKEYVRRDLERECEMTWRLLAAAVLCAGAAGASPAALKPYGSDRATALLLHLDGDTTDASPVARAAGARGVRWTDDGVMGKALCCDGTQAISAEAPGDLSGGFTVEAWVWLVRPDGIGDYGLVEWKDVFRAGFEAARGCLMKPVLSVSTDKGTFTFRGSHSLPYRRWVHLAFTYDPAAADKEQLSMFLHGKFAPYYAKKRPAVSGRLRSKRRRLVIARGLVGRVDELRVSTKVRAEKELICPWLSGRAGDFEPYRADVTAPRRPAGWRSAWLQGG